MCAIVLNCKHLAGAYFGVSGLVKCAPTRVVLINSDAGRAHSVCAASQFRLPCSRIPPTTFIIFGDVAFTSEVQMK